MAVSAMKKCSVLMADDHNLVAEAFSEFLCRAGDYTVAIAKDVLEAKAEIHAAGHFDIVLLDLFKVVVLTGGTSRFRQSSIFAAGAAGIILKSQPAIEILEALQSIRDGEIYFPIADDRHLDRVVSGILHAAQ